jgi:ferrochelatase
MVPLGFVSDHIETLHEMDETYAGLARSLGMEFHRMPALNDDPTFLRALAGMCHARLNGKD